MLNELFSVSKCKFLQVEDQQKYLDIAGIPGMRQTTEGLAIKKQMFMLSIIEDLPQPE